MDNSLELVLKRNQAGSRLTSNAKHSFSHESRVARLFLLKYAKKRGNAKIYLIGVKYSV
jgi:hypothetical protein